MVSGQHGMPNFEVCMIVVRLCHIIGINALAGHQSKFLNSDNSSQDWIILILFINDASSATFSLIH